MDSKTLQALIYKTIDDAKGNDIKTLDVSNISSITDYMMIVSGTSKRHTASIAEKLIRALRDHGFRYLGIEGKAVGEWVLIDYGDVIVHIMLPAIREFYNLEKLWGENDVLQVSKN